MAFVDATVVKVALPAIERDFDTGLAGEQWIVLSYSLALASLYLVGGARTGIATVAGPPAGGAAVAFAGISGAEARADHDAPSFAT